MQYQVKSFQTSRGNYPVEEFIRQQEKQTITKILHLITLLRDFGPNLRMPFSKKVRKDLYELRVSGKEAIRIFYTNKGNTFYLVHAFKKKVQKTPRKEIKIALDRINEIV